MFTSFYILSLLNLQNLMTTQNSKYLMFIYINLGLSILTLILTLFLLIWLIIEYFRD